ncbi:MAG: transcription termination/antitermination protein NusA [Deltaproteobacteria bacterium]|nr:transcription termination/antitermination protein NusA [Deltaproteobacteria bacterium]
MAAVTEANELDSDLTRVINVVSRDKNLDKAVIIDALEQAVLHAARRDYGATADLEAHYNEDSNEIELFQFRTVVQDVEDKVREISVPEAHRLDPEAGVGDALGIKIDTASFGRIAAQSAKQIIVQKVRDAERAQIYDEFKDRTGEILSGHVRRFERHDIIVDLGRTEAVIPYREQMPTERYRVKDRITGYVLEVKRSSRGPQIVMSRAHPGFLVRLFEQHVTEIYDGIVTIESAARDPGHRSKIAVYSRDPSVDPVGACVGMKGARVQAVVQELNGEKIDIVPWDKDPARLVCNALAPAVVSKVIVDEANHSMEVIVADDQLSLAIGKRGQNVRLAAQLTGWRLDIKSEGKLEQELVGAKISVANIAGIGPMRAEILVNEGVKSPADVAALSSRTLQRLLNMEEADADKVIEEATRIARESGREIVPVRDEHDEESELLAHAAAEPTKAPVQTKEVEVDSARGDRLKLFQRLIGVGEATAHALADAGYGTIGDIIADSAEEVAQKTGLSIGIARTVQIAADKYLQSELVDGSEDE